MEIYTIKLGEYMMKYEDIQIYTRKNSIMFHSESITNRFSLSSVSIFICKDYFLHEYGKSILFQDMGKMIIPKITVNFSFQTEALVHKIRTVGGNVPTWPG